MIILKTIILWFYDFFFVIYSIFTIIILKFIFSEIYRYRFYEQTDRPVVAFRPFLELWGPRITIPPCLCLSEHLQSSNLQNPGSQTPTPPPSHLINFPFSSVIQGSFEIHRGCIILVRPFLHSTSLKKRKTLKTSGNLKIKEKDVFYHVSKIKTFQIRY